MTPRMTDILRKLRRYKFLTTKQIRNWCVPNDKDGSITREVLRKLQSLGLAKRSQAEVNNPLTTAASPVWMPTDYGCSLLVIETNDASQLLDAIPCVRNWMQFAHFVAVSELVHTIEKAFDRHTIAKLGKVVLEHDVIENPRDPTATIRLYTVVSQREGRKIVCVPDFAFEVIVGNFRRVYFCELERGSDTPTRVQRRKHPGYSGMHEHFQKLFPDAQDWRVLFIWPNTMMRDAARKLVTDEQSKTWLFAALPDMTERFIDEPVICKGNNHPRALIDPSYTAPESHSGDHSPTSPPQRGIERSI